MYTERISYPRKCHYQAWQSYQAVLVMNTGLFKNQLCKCCKTKGKLNLHSEMKWTGFTSEAKNSGKGSNKWKCVSAR